MVWRTSASSAAPTDSGGCSACHLVDRPGLRRHQVDGEGYARARATLPDVTRGYEDIKLRNVERFRDAVHTLGF
jgi:hypothetical protein